MKSKDKQTNGDTVITENFIAGMRMASEMIRPAAVTFLDKMRLDKEENLRVEEILINEKYSGKKIEELELAVFGGDRERLDLVGDETDPGTGGHLVDRRTIGGHSGCGRRHPAGALNEQNMSVSGRGPGDVVRLARGNVGERIHAPGAVGGARRGRVGQRPAADRRHHRRDGGNGSG